MNRAVLYLLTSLLAALLCGIPLAAQPAGNMPEADSLEVSLVTCAPGDAAYELYGHTALRVRNLNISGEDWVYNYGMFDFSAPHFTWRFMLGQTDYFMAAQPYAGFVNAYGRDGRAVELQVLNLTRSEKARLLASLQRTLREPGWTYRYSFLYDNCTTRAVDEVVRCLDGCIVWGATADTTKTYRDVIHEFAGEISPWSRFGQDLVLGAEADLPLGQRGLLFSPVYAAQAFDNAVIRDCEGQLRPLVLERETVMVAAVQSADPYPVSPMIACWLLAIMTALVCVVEWRRRCICHFYDDGLMLLWGGAGCIVAVLFFFSEHPAVGSNWLILLLNPLPLFYLPVKVWRNCKQLPDHFHTGVIVAIALWGVAGGLNRVAGGVIQNFPPEIYVLALILLARSISVRALQKKYDTV